MKAFLFYLSTFLIGLSSVWIYYSSQKTEERVVQKLRSPELTEAFSKISKAHQETSPNKFTPNHEDLQILEELTPEERSLAEAILLAEYSEGISEEDYDSRMERFRESLNHNPEANFEAALKLRAHPGFDTPDRQLALVHILTAIKGKEREGLEIALSDARLEVEEKKFQEADQFEKDVMLRSVQSYRLAVSLMKDQGMDAYEETIKTLEMHSNTDVKRGIVEEFENAYPELKGKIKI